MKSKPTSDKKQRPQWTCPYCRKGHLVEVILAIREHNVLKLNDKLEVDHVCASSPDYDYAHIIKYICNHCGHDLPVVPDNPADINNHQALKRYLKSLPEN